jgi:DNA-binding MarR family transcriptional regulator
MARLDATRVGVWRELQSVGAAVERRIDDVLIGEWQVPLGWFDVLAALQRLGGRARPSELAGELRLVRSSLSRRLDRLEEEGWVARSRPSARDDHRAVVVELTPRGRTLWREMNVTYRRALQRHIAGHLSDTDVGDLRRILANLAAGLDGRADS